VALDQGGKLINAKPANLARRQRPPSRGLLAERAAVFDGHAREDEGRLFHLTLDLTRFYANERVRLCQLDTLGDLAVLRASASGMDVLRKLAGAAWTYWMPQPGHDFPGVRKQVIECATHNIDQAPPAAEDGDDDNIENFVATAAAQKLLLEEMQRGDAAHWGDSTRRITGNFIAVEQREEGTVMLRRATPAMTNVAGAIVPAREAELYMVAGIAEGIGQMLARQTGLALPVGPLELTLLPYRGRYFYDVSGNASPMQHVPTLIR
jgi:hypothetical protein